MLAAVDEKVEAGQLAGQGEESATPAAATTGAQVIDLAELLSKSIQVANKPGPAKAKRAPEAEAADEEEKPKTPAKKRSASA